MHARMHALTCSLHRIFRLMEKSESDVIVFGGVLKECMLVSYVLVSLQLRP